MTSSLFVQLFNNSTLCRLCRGPSQGLSLCPACAAELPLRHQKCNCKLCALPLSGSLPREVPPDSAAAAPFDPICPECLAHPPPFNTTICPLRYEAPVDKWLHNFKYNGDLRDGKLLTQLLIGAVEQRPHPLPELLIPLSMPPKRQWLRGFNQTQWIARQLARRLNLPILNALKSSNRAHRQAQAARPERLANQRNQFHTTPNAVEKLRGRRIALIDDVMTTGATARSACKLLKDSGAYSVELWIIARTAKTCGKTAKKL